MLLLGLGFRLKMLGKLKLDACLVIGASTTVWTGLARNQDLTLDNVASPDLAQSLDLTYKAATTSLYGFLPRTWEANQVPAGPLVVPLVPALFTYLHWTKNTPQGLSNTPETLDSILLGYMYAEVEPRHRHNGSCRVLHLRPASSLP